MECTIAEQTIFDAINEIREKKKRRPDKERIATRLLEAPGLAMASTLEVIDSMINENKIINIKTTKGEDSFYEAESHVNPLNQAGNKGNKSHPKKIRR